MLKKKEFFSEVSKVANVPVKETEAVVNGVKEVVFTELNKGEKVSVPGLGVFKPKVKEGGLKTIYNPAKKIKEEKMVESKVVVQFKGEKGLLLELSVPKKKNKKK